MDVLAQRQLLAGATGLPDSGLANTDWIRGTLGAAHGQSAHPFGLGSVNGLPSLGRTFDPSLIQGLMNPMAAPAAGLDAAALRDMVTMSGLGRLQATGLSILAIGLKTKCTVEIAV